MRHPSISLPLRSTGSRSTGQRSVDSRAAGSRVLLAALSATALVALVPAHAAAAAAPLPSAAHLQSARAASAGALHVLPSGRLSCTGIVAFRQQARVAGRPVAELDVYASSADGGRFVACTRHVGATVGVRLPTQVSITGATTFDGRRHVTASEGGRYGSFAGPVGIGGARGLCFRATGSLTTGGHTLTLASPMVCAKAK